MKLKKIFAATAAAAVTVGSLAISVSAGGGAYWVRPEGTEFAEGCYMDSGLYLIQLLNDGDNNEGKPATDYGVNPNDVAAFKVYVEVVGSEDATAEEFDFGMGDGGFGGAFIYSANGGDLGKSLFDSDVYDEATGQTYYGKYNWPGDMSWWGLPFETDTPDDPENHQGTVTYDEQYTYMEYIDKLHYKMSATIPESCLWPSLEERRGTCYQIGLQEWSDPLFHYLKVNMFIVLDSDGNPLIAFDELGNPIQDEAEIKKMMDEFDTPKVISEPSTPEGDATNAPEASGDSSTTNAPEASADNTNAPTTTAASSSNGGSNVGLIIGIIAAVVVVVVVVVVIVIKKKKS